MAITMDDIAKRVGVSKVTVSRVLSNNNSHIPISENTRQKVLEAVKELNYQPNYLAQSLRSGKRYSIGVASSGNPHLLYDPWLDAYYQGVSEVLAEKEYAMSFLPQGTKSIEEMLVRVSQSKMVDGLIILVYAHYYADFIDSALPKLHATGLPFVVIHSCNKPFSCHNVCLDSVAIGEIAAKHLLEQGYDKVGFLYLDHLQVEQFYKGYERVILEAGKRPVKVNVGPGLTDHSENDGYTFGQELVKNKNLADAYVVSTDHFAQGMLYALREAGIEVPGKVGLVACNNATVNAHRVTELTTIDRQGVVRARKAAEILFDVIEKKGIKEGEFISHLEQPELIIRNSSLRSRSEDRGPRTE